MDLYQIQSAHALALASHNREDFDKNYFVSLLDICSPKVLDIREHKLIHTLNNTLTPNGLNLDNPFAIPLLHRQFFPISKIF